MVVGNLWNRTGVRLMVVYSWLLEASSLADYAKEVACEIRRSS